MSFKLEDLPALTTRGFAINPPIVDLALEAGDTYNFIYGSEQIYTVFDGSVWRYVYAKQVGIQYDFDSSVVTIL